MRLVSPDFCIWLYPTNEEEVPKTITNPVNKLSSGADAINNIIVMSIAHAITRTIVKLINYSLVTGSLPEQLAVGNIIPLQRKGSKEELISANFFTHSHQ